MTPDEQQLLQLLGAQVVQSIKGPWATAAVDVDFETGVITAKGKYTRPGESELIDFRVPGIVNHIVAKLRELVRREDRSQWKSARYTLVQGGEFHIDFTY